MSLSWIVYAALAPNRLLTSVPAGATTGPITVAVGSDTASSPTAFTVEGVLAVDPTSLTLWRTAGRRNEAEPVTLFGAPHLTY